jgi:hypothetical protein
MKFALDRSLINRSRMLGRDLAPAAIVLRDQYEAQSQQWRNTEGDDIRAKIENLEATIDSLDDLAAEAVMR